MSLRPGMGCTYHQGEPSPCSPDQLRDWMDARGHTPTALARRWGVTYVAVWNWLRGRHRVPPWAVEHLRAEGALPPAPPPAVAPEAPTPCAVRCPAATFAAWVRGTGYTQTEVAAVLRVSRATVVNWMGGRHQIPARVADYLAREGVPIPCSNAPCPKYRATERRRCAACDWYWQHHRVERPAALCTRVLPSALGTACANPACDAPRDLSRYRRRCVPCDLYWRRHQAERPDALIHPTPLCCGVPGCRKAHHARGYCRAHYARYCLPAAEARCTHVDCTQPQHARQWCRPHYLRWWRAQRAEERSA